MTGGWNRLTINETGAAIFAKTESINTVLASIDSKIDEYPQPDKLDGRRTIKQYPHIGVASLR